MIHSRRIALMAGLALLPWTARAQPEGRGGGGQGRGQGQGNQGGGQGNQGRGNQGQGGPGNSGGRGNGGGGQAGNAGRGGPPSMGGSDRVTIRSWLSANPGYTAQPLPPGMYNRLSQGKPLPPGIARRAAPPDLIRLLPVYPGHEYVVVGTSIVLVSIATGVVASILADALLR